MQDVIKIAVYAEERHKAPGFVFTTFRNVQNKTKHGDGKPAAWTFLHVPPSIETLQWKTWKRSDSILNKQEVKTYSTQLILGGSFRFTSCFSTSLKWDLWQICLSAVHDPTAQSCQIEFSFSPCRESVSNHILMNSSRRYLSNKCKSTTIKRL